VLGEDGIIVGEETAASEQPVRCAAAIKLAVGKVIDL